MRDLRFIDCHVSDSVGGISVPGQSGSHGLLILTTAVAKRVFTAVPLAHSLGFIFIFHFIPTKGWLVQGRT